MSSLAELTILPGIVSNETDRGAKGRWKDGDHVRFRNGLPEKVGGARALLVTGATVVGYDEGKIHGIARSLHDWVALDGAKWIAIGTHKKLYVFNTDTLYDITPLRATEALTDPFTTTNGLPTVTVADVGHGASVGDFVTFSGASAVGGITINGNGDRRIFGVGPGGNLQLTNMTLTGGAANGGNGGVNVWFH